ncbi:DNA starvation/stationary phase protection protein [Rhodothalassium salexigens]|uniref:Dps family protein n=1 Tax=Rhodothalassium salexigens TaxID=1086 RepID=UPI0019135B75|nr:Dps family protein [Rhodothalassium salexigens]MBK5921891.1 DNA starvation/stationary phase protection protein [Rhodothalassium salexigens]
MSINVGIEDNSRKSIAEGLKVLLADTYSLYIKTQNYHWNVVGPMFKSVHEMTEEQYTELATANDEIAERIRQLGVKAPGGYKAFADLTAITDGDENKDAQAMVAELAGDHETIVRRIRPMQETADKAGDNATVALLDDRLTAHEKAAWMLRSMAS